MLELVTARPPIHKNKYIVREVEKAINYKDYEYYGLEEVVDPVIHKERQLKGFREFVELALRCIEESSINRPTMGDVVKELEAMVNGDDGSSRSSSITSSSSGYPMRAKDIIRNPFEYSSGYSFSIELQPK